MIVDSRPGDPTLPEVSLMKLRISCTNPACRKSAEVPADFLGKSVRCRSCSTAIRVTTDSPTTDAAAHPDRTADGTAAHPPAGSIALERLGRFEIRSRLGAGAFGTVYRAYDPQLDREVALKVPNAGALDSPKRVERFLREAKAAANLRHPNVVPVYDAGREGDRYYIAAAFVRGRPLAAVIDDGPLALPRAVHLARQLAEALDYAHREGVVHRDVKPANVMVDDHDRVHLMDFGLAVRQAEEARLTADGAVIGTPAYMAPEQAAGQSAEARPAADQYALGVVLYELLTGRLPFEGPLAAVLHHHIHSEPARPTTLRMDIPADLETVCLKALAKPPAGRYPSCGDLADDLRRWQEGEPIRARRLGPVERTVRWAKANRGVAGLAVALAVTLALGTLVSSALAVWALWSADQAKTQEQRANEKAEAESQLTQEVEARAQVIESQKVDLEKEVDKTGDALKQAKDALTLAKKNEDDAKKAAANAEAEKNKKEQALADVEKTNAQLKAEQAENARRFYQVRMLLVQNAWKEQRRDLMTKYIREVGASSDPALRGFEWHYWQRFDTGGAVVVGGAKGAVPMKLLAVAETGDWFASPYGPDPAGKTGVALLDTTTGGFLRWLADAPTDATDWQCSPDATKVLAVGRHAVTVWDAATGRKLWAKDPDPDAANPTEKAVCRAACFSKSGKTVRVVAGRQLPAPVKPTAPKDWPYQTDTLYAFDVRSGDPPQPAAGKLTFAPPRLTLSYKSPTPVIRLIHATEEPEKEEFTLVTDPVPAKGRPADFPLPLREHNLYATRVYEDPAKPGNAKVDVSFHLRLPQAVTEVEYVSSMLASPSSADLSLNLRRSVLTEVQPFVLANDEDVTVAAAFSAAKGNPLTIGRSTRSNKHILTGGWKSAKPLDHDPGTGCLALLNEGDASIRLLDTDGSSDHRYLAWGHGRATAAAFAPGKSRFLLSTADGRVRIWDFLDEQYKWRHKQPEKTAQTPATPSSAPREVVVASIKDGRSHLPFRLSGGSVMVPVKRDLGNTLTVQAVSLANGGWYKDDPLPLPYVPRLADELVAYSTDGGWRATGVGATVSLENLKGARQTTPIDAGGKIRSLATGRAGRRLLIGTDTRYRVWDRESGEFLQVEQTTGERTENGARCDYHLDEFERFLTVARRKPSEVVYSVYDLDAGKPSFDYRPTADAHPPVFSPRGDQFTDGSLVPRRVPSAAPLFGQPVSPLHHPEADPVAGRICYAPDGKRLAVISDQNIVTVFDTDTYEEVLQLRYKPDPNDLKQKSAALERIAFTSDGHQLVGQTRLNAPGELVIWGRPKPADPPLLPEPAR